MIRSLHTEAINHDPAMTMLQTGHQIAGPAVAGRLALLRLGFRERQPARLRRDDLAASGPHQCAAVARADVGRRLSAAALSGRALRPGKDPVLFLSNPPGITAGAAAGCSTTWLPSNRLKLDDYHDPEIQSRIEQYEMAFRMQTAVPELADLSQEPAAVFDRYGPESRKPGTYAANCILARRLAERGVRFIQLYHRGWDQHNNLPRDIRSQCYDTDQPTAALIEDLQQRGLLDDTLVVWGGEFGRTVYSQGTLTADNYGRDHHPRCFSHVDGRRRHQAGHVHGETDDYLLQHRPRSGPHPRPERHDAATAGHRPHAAHVPLPGPRFPPDGRARRGGEGHAGLRANLRD